MRLPELHDFFRRNGWYMKPNSSAYYSDKSPTTRYKINKLVIRKETLVRYADGSHSWMRLASASISKLTLSPEGKMQGFKR